MNQINLVGRLVADVRTNQTADGTKICSGRIAVPRSYGQKEGQQPITDFFNFSAFRGTAEIISNYCKKGHLVAFSGSLQNQDWTDEQGQPHQRIVVVVNSVTLLEKKNVNSDQQQNQYQQPNNNYNNYNQPQPQYNPQFQQPQQPQSQFYQPQPQPQYTQPNFNKPQQNVINDNDLPWIK